MAGPDFIGIGVQKAATTWLFKRLCMHPDIYFPQGKELHFWNRKQESSIRSVSQYARVFDSIGNTYFGEKSGEITPAYLTLSETHIRELAELAPEVRLIVTLRDPVERALSAAAQHRVFRPEEASKSDPLFWPRTLEPGLYAQHLTRWRACFPPEQLLILKYEDIARDPRALLQHVARHIGVDPGVYDLIDINLLARRYFQTPTKIVPEENVIAGLRDYYRADMAALEQMLGSPMGWWN